MRHQALAGRRQHDAAPTPLDQRDIHLAFEQGDLLRHGRRRQVQRLGSGRHGAATGQFTQGAQAGDVHGRISIVKSC